ncbi:hypothetical protein AAG906_000853 [Vitis piasezkii]
MRLRHRCLTRDWRPSISGSFEMLERLDANALDTPFMEDEVFDALVGCNGDKVRGRWILYGFWLFAWDFAYKLGGKLVQVAGQGLRINLEKSELIPVGRVESMDDLAGDFGCSLGSLPTTYLGMPLAFNDREIEEAERFMERIDGKFSVKSLFIALEAGGSSLFPSSFIWNVNVQPKISFFAWEATWGKTLTLDLVQKRMSLGE